MELAAELVEFSIIAKWIKRLKDEKREAGDHRLQRCWLSCKDRAKAWSSWVNPLHVRAYKMFYILFGAHQKLIGN